MLSWVEFVSVVDSIPPKPIFFLNIGGLSQIDNLG